MKKRGRLAVNESLAAHAILANRLADMLFDAAMMGQGMWGRGVLSVKSASEGLAWTYKPLADLNEELMEWAELEGLLSAYDPESEVVIALLDDGDFFRLPLSSIGNSA